MILVEKIECWWCEVEGLKRKEMGKVLKWLFLRIKNNLIKGIYCEIRRDY